MSHRCARCGGPERTALCCGDPPEVASPKLTLDEVEELEEWLEGANPVFRERVLAVARAALGREFSQ